MGFMVRLLVRYRWFLLVFVLALAVDLVTKAVVFERLGLDSAAVQTAVEEGWERYERQQEAIDDYEQHFGEVNEANEDVAGPPPPEPPMLYFSFPHRHQHELVENYLYFTAVLNPGAFGGMLGGQVVMLLVLSFVAVLIVGWILFRAAWPRYQITGGLIIAGAFGNIHDRIVFGAVRDFVDFRLPEAGVSWLNPWNTFNFADAAIVGGILALLVIELLYPLEGYKKKQKDAAAAATEEDGTKEETDDAPEPEADAPSPKGSEA